MAHRDNRDTGAGEHENYWSSGLHGNAEEYEKYLAIKSRLEGKPYRRPKGKRGGGERRISLLTYYPAMKWALLLVLFVNATRIASAYRQWGMAGAFTSKALYWGLASLLIYWYFARRDPENGTLSLLGRVLPDVAIPGSLPYWIFLSGWIFATFNLNDINIWVRWGEELLRQYEYSVDCSAFLSLPLPRTPPFLKLLGGILSTVMGGLLFFDMLVSKAMKRS